MKNVLLLPKEVIIKGEYSCKFGVSLPIESLAQFKRLQKSSGETDYEILSEKQSTPNLIQPQLKLMEKMQENSFLTEASGLKMPAFCNEC